MSKSPFDASPGKLRERSVKRDFGRQPGCASCPQGLGHRAQPWQLPASLGAAGRRAGFWLMALGAAAALGTSLPAAESPAPPKPTNSLATAKSWAAGRTTAAPRFDVRAYVIKRDPLVFTNTPAARLSRYTGTNVGLEQIVRAAAEVLSEYGNRAT